MFPYILVYFLLLVPIKKRYINNWCFFILLVFIIIRFDVGWDYRWYYVLGEQQKLIRLPLLINTDSFSEYYHYGVGVFDYLRCELLTKFIYKITWFLKFPPEFAIGIHAFLMLYFFKKGLENFKLETNITWIIFYTFPLFYFSFFSLIRQGVAICIVFYSYKYIKEKNFLKYIFYILLAFFFHKSAFIMLFAYFLQFLRLKEKYKYFLFGLLIISIFCEKIIQFILTNIHIPIIYGYRAYFVPQEGISGTKIYYLILVIYIYIFVLTIFNSAFIKKNYTLINYYTIGSFIYLTFRILRDIGIRASIYMLFFLIPIVGKGSLNNKKFKYVILVLCFLLLNLRLVNDLKQNIRQEFIPYQTIFNKKILKKYKNLKESENYDNTFKSTIEIRSSRRRNRCFSIL